MHTKTKEIFEASAPFNNEFQGSATRALFVCSAGMLRSATAAALGARAGLNTRSCGTEEYSLIPLTANLILWADKIYFVHPSNYMHALDAFQAYPILYDVIKNKAIVWEIEDDYDYMNPELVKIISKLLP
jgi:predicted protein tyrosine phosphatase